MDVSKWKDAAHFEFDFRGDAERLGFNAHDCTLCVLRGERWKCVNLSHHRFIAYLSDGVL